MLMLLKGRQFSNFWLYIVFGTTLLTFILRKFDSQDYIHLRGENIKKSENEDEGLERNIFVKVSSNSSLQKSRFKREDDAPDECYCSRLQRPILIRNEIPLNEQSTCSEYSTLRGPNQKVFSYSFYRPGFISKEEDMEAHFNKYLNLIEDKLITIDQYYPGWILRLYHNVTKDQMKENEFLCKLHCTYAHLDLCHVSRLPVIGNLAKNQPIGRLWRFAVLGDPTVSTFFCRDSDSAILEREVETAKEWFKSGKRFHLIRDHPAHTAPIHAGLWGAKNDRSLSVLRNAMLNSPIVFLKTYDQFLLKKIVWPVIKNDVLQHVSYTCGIKTFGKTVPFPSKRKGGLYVGWGPFKIKEKKMLLNRVCPLECRHPDHEESEFC